MKMKRVLFASLLFSAGVTEAATVGGITLPKKQDNLMLQGAGLLRKGLIFKIYVGALYLEEPAHAHAVLSDVPKRIDIHYFHHTPKKYMLKVAEETLRENLSPEQYKALSPKIEKLHNAFMNGRKGSFASIVHEPGKGLCYAFDNEPVITIPGDDFANAYFSIWLGERPSSRSVKEAMLNKE